MKSGVRREHGRLLSASELGARRAAARRRRTARRAGLLAVLALAITTAALLILSCASRSHRKASAAAAIRVTIGCPQPAGADGHRTSPAAAQRSSTSERGTARRGHLSGRLISTSACPGISTARNTAITPNSTRATTDLHLPNSRVG
jgi:hypothetical protein